MLRHLGKSEETGADERSPIQDKAPKSPPSPTAKSKPANPGLATLPTSQAQASQGRAINVRFGYASESEAAIAGLVQDYNDLVDTMRDRMPLPRATEDNFLQIMPMGLKAVTSELANLRDSVGESERKRGEGQSKVDRLMKETGRLQELVARYQADLDELDSTAGIRSRDALDKKARIAGRKDANTGLFAENLQIQELAAQSGGRIESLKVRKAMQDKQMDANQVEIERLKAALEKAGPAASEAKSNKKKALEELDELEKEHAKQMGNLKSVREKFGKAQNRDTAGRLIQMEESHAQAKSELHSEIDGFGEVDVVKAGLERRNDERIRVMDELQQHYEARVRAANQFLPHYHRVVPPYNKLVADIEQLAAEKIELGGKIAALRERMQASSEGVDDAQFKAEFPGLVREMQANKKKLEALQTAADED
jgi:chromosome segregation ATPase